MEVPEKYITDLQGRSRHSILHIRLSTGLFAGILPDISEK